MKVFMKAGLLFVATALVSGCRQVPDYSAAPAITLKEVKKTVITRNGLQVDQIEFTINFTDGDGDLGLNPEAPDTNAPFNFTTQDSITPDGDTLSIPNNVNYHNWFTTFKIKQGTEFVPYVFPQPGLTFNGRFPRLVQDNNEGPIDGTITYSIELIQILFQPNQEAKFDIQIQDRSLQRSNKIETGVIILNQQ